MKTTLLAILASALLTPALQAKPESLAGRGGFAERREAIKNLTPEQKTKFKERAKDKWESLSPEEKAKLKERALARVAELSPEKKAELKARLKARIKDLSAEDRAAFLEKYPIAAELLK
jgi:hypothetical protein